MCVIIIKKSGQPLPPKDMLQAAYRANSHGCGFCSDSHFYKSLSFADFYTKLQRVSFHETCIMHFRLATHGSICTANCHPFIYRNLAFAHNGVLSVRPVGDLTDSETAFRLYIAPAFDTYGYDTPKFKCAINAVLKGSYASKLAMLYDGKLSLYGTFVSYGGYLCSNLRFLKYLHTNSNKLYNHYETAHITH